MKRTSLVLSVLMILTLTAGSVYAQEGRGSIRGLITDDTGGVIPGVGVKAEHIATGVDLVTITNDSGNYLIDHLNPGEYSLTVSLPGFKTTRRVVDLRTGDKLTIDFTMQLGEVTEEVTVEAATPLLQSASGDLDHLLDNRNIESIPLSQGNPTYLITLAPGASASAGYGWKYDEPGWTITTGFTFHGVAGNQLGYSLNGINNTSSIFGSGAQAMAQPSTEAVEELKISEGYDATTGHHNGTTMDVTLKSGTNDFHGSVYGFFRNSDWNAGAFFDNRAGSEKTPATYRRYGGGVTGPIIKDRTFFAFSYEDSFQKTTEFYGLQTIPSAAMLQGDFSGLTTGGGEPINIYDPLTTREVMVDGNLLFQRDPFPNNQIPSSRIHPMAQTLMQYWPEPNVGGRSDGTQNFQPTFPSPTGWKQYFARVDHTFTDKHRIFGHYSELGDWSGEWRDYYGNLATGFWESIRRQNFGIDDVYVVNPNWLLNFQYGYMRGTDPLGTKSHPRTPGGHFDITTLPYPQSLLNQLDLDNTSLPHIVISGFQGIHDETRNGWDGLGVHTADASTDVTRGNHNFQLGVEFRSSTLNETGGRWIMPRNEFGSDFTNGPFNTDSALQGQGLAAFLLGQPSGGFINRFDSRASHNNYWSWFIQDNWRVTPRLTINLGLRWEHWTAVTERFNRTIRDFAFGTPSPIAAGAQAAYAGNPIPELAASAFQVNGGYLFAGVDGQPRELYGAPGQIFAPRIGFAYRLRETTVLRGGYGIFHVPMGIGGAGSFAPLQFGYSRRTDLIASRDNGLTFDANIQNPFPGGILEPTGNSLGLLTDLGQSARFFNTTGLKAPYVQRWSLTLQQMLPNDTLVEIGYVGTRGTKLLGSRNLNVLPARFLNRSNSRNQSIIDNLSGSVPNPFQGLIPGTSLGESSTISKAGLLTPFPHFPGGVTLAHVNQGYSYYHGLETRFEKRFNAGHSYGMSWTWSKAMQAVSFLNPSDPVPYKVVSGNDRTLVFSLNGLWELPFGQGKPFGSGVSSGVDRVIGGWKVATIWHLQGGFPLTFGDAFTTSNFDPERLPLPRGQRTIDRWFNTDAGFVKDSAAQPSSFHLRTFPLRFSSLRSDSINFWDISVIKDTYIGEAKYIRFQAQFLNAFNHPTFGGANTNPASGGFGTVDRDLTWPRRIMLGFKFVF